jgi:hypothetical protein
MLNGRVTALNCPHCHEVVPIRERRWARKAPSYEITECYDCAGIIVVDRHDDGLAFSLRKWPPE